MMERDEIISSAPGVKLRGTMRDKLYGWEFRALVEEKSFRRKEKVLDKSNGGWINLIEDIDAVVLFANGFEEVIKPVSHLESLCSGWKTLPKDKDYLAVGCPMLETLYNEAGSRKTRTYLTSTHLQWDRGPKLFERCVLNKNCACNRLQGIVYDSKTTFRRVDPPDELPENGCVIFGQARHPMIPDGSKSADRQKIFSMRNGPLQKPQHFGSIRLTDWLTASVSSQPVTDQISGIPESLSSARSHSDTRYDADSAEGPANSLVKRRRELTSQEYREKGFYERQVKRPFREATSAPSETAGEELKPSTSGTSNDEGVKSSQPLLETKFAGLQAPDPLRAKASSETHEQLQCRDLAGLSVDTRIDEERLANSMAAANTGREKTDHRRFGIHC